MNANQYGALVSWALNVGCEASGTSALIESINLGDDATKAAAKELPFWNVLGGKVLPSLDARRKEEIRLASIPTRDNALPASCEAM